MNLRVAIKRELAASPKTPDELAEALAVVSRAQIRNVLSEMFHENDEHGRPAGTGLLCDSEGRFYLRGSKPANGVVVTGWDPRR